MQWWSGAHSRGEIRAKTSSIGGESPITNPSTEPGERRRNGQTARFTRGATRGERLRRFDSLGGSDEESCFSGY
ncbi:hypothetical protein ABVT39_014683 [Epinephelus coioides]